MARRKFETNAAGDSYMTTVQSLANGVCDNKLYFAARLKELRTIAHLTQAEFAERLHLSKSAIANWESGRTRPDLANVPSLCRVLGISIEEFFCDSAEKIDAKTDEGRLLFFYRNLYRGHQQALLTLAEKLLEAETEMAAPKKIELVRIPLAEDAVAAGFNLADFSSGCKPIYLHSSPMTRRADLIFHVSGDSMEPEFPNHSYVLVKCNESQPHVGDVGIFQVDNSLYIKEYRREGLHSLNPKWPLMRKSDYGEIRFIGRVIGVVDNDEFATTEEVKVFTKGSVEQR